MWIYGQQRTLDAGESHKPNDMRKHYFPTIQKDKNHFELVKITYSISLQYTHLSETPWKNTDSLGIKLSL